MFSLWLPCELDHPSLQNDYAAIRRDSFNHSLSSRLARCLAAVAVGRRRTPSAGARFQCGHWATHPNAAPTPGLKGVTDSAPVGAPIAANESDRPKTITDEVAFASSDFRLLGDLESIIDLDAEVPHRRFQLGMSEEQLHSAKVLGAPIDQSRLRPSH